MTLFFYECGKKALTGLLINDEWIGEEKLPPKKSLNHHPISG